VPVYSSVFHSGTGSPPPPNPGALVQVGAVFPIEVHVPTRIAELKTKEGAPVPKGASGLALLDTGATLTGIDRSVPEALGVPPVGQVETGTAAGKAKHSTYPARLVFTSIPNLILEAQAAVGVDLSGLRVQFGQAQPPQPIIALIGRDVLSNWLLVWNGPMGMWSISF
jgi:predicted aspartyl protease